MVIGAGSHPFPFRTRKLSLIPPMVLHGKLCGRVGRCRHFFHVYAGSSVASTQFPMLHGLCCWAASQARRRCGRVGRCRHFFHVYAGSSVASTQFPMLHGLCSLGRLASSAAVWESRSLPAFFSRVRRQFGRQHTVSHAAWALFSGRLASSAAVWESRSLPAFFFTCTPAVRSPTHSFPCCMGSVCRAASRARRRCGRAGRCRHFFPRGITSGSRELRFAGFCLYPAARSQAHLV